MNLTSDGERDLPKSEGLFSKVFRDPVHNLIRLGQEDRFILDLIDTKEFQRLRRIRQLGLGHFVYPGAEHTRFVHSLGVFNFARRIVRKLKERHAQDADPEVREELKEKTRTIEAAALLHDLGHGPFSHVYERVFQDASTPDHEQWTGKILLDESTEVAEVLRNNGIDVDQVVALICDSPPDAVRPLGDPYLKDIVHGQLDADRMDYLLRDSLMTGSRYGEFDSEWILNVLSLGTMRSGTQRVMKLCLDPRKGTGAIEHLLHARLLMTKYVYGHKTTRAYEAELVNTLQLALELSDVLPDDTPTPVRTVLQNGGQVTTKEYLLLDDDIMWWALRRWAVWKPELKGSYGEAADALRRHSLRLVRRSKPWATVRLTTSQMIRGATALIKQIRADKNNPILRYECYLDTMATWPYKDPAVAVHSGVDPEEAYFEDIHVLDESGRAVPIREAEDTHILGALAEKWAERRFHFDRKYCEDFTT